MPNFRPFKPIAIDISAAREREIRRILDNERRGVYGANDFPREPRPPLPDHPQVEPGERRDQIQGLISPTRQISETTIFEDAIDATRKFFIPIFKVAEEIVDSVHRFRLAMRWDGSKGTLRVTIAGSARGPANASPVEVSVAALLRFVAPTSGLVTELEFAVNKVDAGTWEAL